MKTTRSHRLSLAALLLAAGGMFVGCSQETPPAAPKFEIADGSGETSPPGTTTIPAPPSLEAPQVNPPGTPPAVPNAGGVNGQETPAAVPSTNDPDQMMRELKLLLRQQPKGNNRQEMQQSFIELIVAQVALAAEIVDTSKKEPQRLEAMEVAFQRASGLMEMGHPAGKEFLMEMSKGWSGDAMPSVAQNAQMVMFQLATMELLETGGEGKETYFAFVDKLLKASPDDTTFESMRQACLVLSQTGMTEMSRQMQERLVATFGKKEDPAMQAALKGLDDSLWLTETKFMQALQGLLTKEEGASQAYTEFLAKLSLKQNLGVEAITHLTQALFILEGKDPALAKATADAMESAFAGSADPKIVDEAKQSVSGSRTRLGLIGQPFVVEGKTVAGEPFDWSAYAGKVVLIDFWATWCVPCLEELPNIEENYATYHEQGFDVVGINLDKDAAARDEWLKTQPLPWTTVISANESEVGFKNPLAVKCGVEAIPFVVLVGKDGNVDSIHVRGAMLGERLAALLGPPKDAPAAIPDNPGPTDLPPSPADPAAKPETPTALEAPVNALRSNSACAGEEEEEAPAAEAAPPADAPPANPYSAKPELSNELLVEYLQKMEDKAKSIRRREGFADAIIEACDRVLAKEPTAAHAQYVTETKGLTLHQRAAEGNADAQKQLEKFAAEWSNDTRPRIARLVELFRREEQSLAALEKTPEEIQQALKSLQEYFATEKLDVQHLRLASNTVALINKLEDNAVREKYYQDFGGLYANSRDRAMARYGKKLAKSSAGGGESDLVGKTFEFVGTKVGGEAFEIQSLRGKVVVVDFWATWCGPCIREIPNVIAVFEKHQAAGLEIVGLSLDEDAEALAAFLEQHALPWDTMSGEANQATADKYGVRGIPTMMLLDREGKIVGVSHSIGQLEKKLEELLAAK